MSELAPQPEAAPTEVEKVGTPPLETLEIHAAPDPNCQICHGTGTVTNQINQTTTKNVACTCVK